MADIRLLSDALINKIAAGEVVDRPASVVKELVENSVDAGATSISVTVENAGRTLIRVADNGGGIAPDEAQLSLARHATSKIRSMDDLFEIHTMGFRGEALASIAGVSHLTLVTRQAKDAQGVRVEAHESTVGPAEPCAAPVGTSIEVRDLFYCVPARRKFLRSDTAEFGHIQEALVRVALAQSHVGFSLTHNGRKILDLAATSDHRLRVAEVVGRDHYDNLLPLAFKSPEVQVAAFAGMPALARATARYQYVFLNGRFIRDRSILHAVKEAYRGLIEPSHQPMAVVFITMPPVLFDVNVHPQKIEVRFRDPNAAYRAVLAAIRECLLSRDLTPRAQLRPDAAVPQPVPTAPWRPRDTAAETRRVLADFFKAAPAGGQTTMSGQFEAPVSPATMPGGQSFAVSPAAPLAELPSVLELGQAADGDASVPAEAPVAAKQMSANAPSLPVPGPYRFQQFHQSYIVVEEDDGLVIIDQHALHERIIYEELLERIRRGTLEAQRLLLPVVVPVLPEQADVVERVRPLLARLGIEINHFDAGSIAVQSLPTLLRRLNPAELLKQLLDHLLEEGDKLQDEHLLHEVLDMASCKAAIKAGDPLTDAEIAALLARRQLVDRSSNCPHGRPTTVRLTLRDLERQFKRR
ncbi:MAG: DNA mismatch repair endonuclease MutL [Phycisphaerales bacterium]|nr:DNA mismatch repair endonuclease MutL [Phycisphaerales bacterium]